MLSIRGLSPAYCDEQIKISGNLQVRGNLTALSSKTVKLEFSKDGSGWFGVHYVMTGSGGYYETSSTFGPGNWKARATFEGDATYGPCTNTLNFQVLGSWTKISLSASSSSVKVGERFTLNGKVDSQCGFPPFFTVKVTLRNSTDQRTWTDINSMTTGTFTFQFNQTEGTRGTYYYKCYYAGEGVYKWSMSNVEKVTVS